MKIKLSRLKQIIQEVVEEKYASERMDDIMQSTKEEGVVEEDASNCEELKNAYDDALGKMGIAGHDTQGPPEGYEEKEAAEKAWKESCPAEYESEMNARRVKDQEWHEKAMADYEQALDEMIAEEIEAALQEFIVEEAPPKEE